MPDPTGAGVLGLATGLSPVWRFDPADGLWTSLPTTGGGSDMAWPEVVADPENGRLLAFDPHVLTGAPGATGVLAYDLEEHAWTRLDPPGEVTEPGPQVRMDQYDLAYDTAAERLILIVTSVGSGEPRGETWQFDTNERAWSRGSDVPNTLSGGYPSEGWATCFDPDTGRTWLFADTAMLGYDSRSDDWIVAERGAGWPESMRIGDEEVDPLARAVSDMTLDPVNGRFVVLGGAVRRLGDPAGGAVREGSLVSTDDVWAYDPGANEWTVLLEPSQDPASWGPG